MKSAAIQAEVVQTDHNHLTPRLLEFFDTDGFWTTCHRVWTGLQKPHDSGDYKYARQQLQRGWSFVSALAVPLLVVALLSLLAIPKPIPRITDGAIIKPHPKPAVLPPDPIPLEPIKNEFVIDDTLLAITAPNASSSLSRNIPAATPLAAVGVAPNFRATVTMSDLFPGPPGDRITKELEKGGGSAAGEAAVLRALRWLSHTQRSDGSWQGASPPAMTALAILAFLGHDETPESPEFGEVVQRAMAYLTDVEQDGRIKGSDGHEYALPICAYALCEAAAKVGHPALQEAAERLIGTVIEGQCPEGGFAYNLKLGPPSAQDLSYAGWCMQALKTAQLAQIGDTDAVATALARSLSGCQRWFRGDTGSGSAGGFSYRMTGNSGRSGLTAVGVLSMQLLGGAKLPEAQAGFRWLEQHMPFQWGQNGPAKYSQIYYHYYATQAFFQYGGEAWDRWNEGMKRELPAAQEVLDREASGYTDHEGAPQAIGHWDGKTAGERHTGGDVMDTALSTLMLEVYYRQLGSFKLLATHHPQDTTESLEDKADIPIEIGNG